MLQDWADTTASARGEGSRAPLLLLRAFDMPHSILPTRSKARPQEQPAQLHQPYVQDVMDDDGPARDAEPSAAARPPLTPGTFPHRALLWVSSGRGGALPRPPDGAGEPAKLGTVLLPVNIRANHWVRLAFLVAQGLQRSRTESGAA